ncbi:MAG: FeoC-like transcriptional regulator [Legionella sp.]|nr:FeoC-like transcriptional regulator [Legionella sp.]
MLLALRDYIAKEKCASTEQIARIFRIDVGALQPMLDIWVARGVIKQEREAKACIVACMGCRPKAIKYYYFVSK